MHAAHAAHGHSQGTRRSAPVREDMQGGAPPRDSCHTPPTPSGLTLLEAPPSLTTQSQTPARVGTRQGAGGRRSPCHCMHDAHECTVYSSMCGLPADSSALQCSMSTGGMRCTLAMTLACCISLGGAVQHNYTWVRECGIEFYRESHCVDVRGVQYSVGLHRSASGVVCCG